METVRVRVIAEERVFYSQEHEINLDHYNAIYAAARLNPAIAARMVKDLVDMEDPDVSSFAVHKFLTEI